MLSQVFENNRILNWKKKKKNNWMKSTWWTPTYQCMNIYTREKSKTIWTLSDKNLRNNSTSPWFFKQKPLGEWKRKKKREKRWCENEMPMPNDQSSRLIQPSSKERNILANDNEQTSSMKKIKRKVSRDAYELTDWQSGKKRIRRKILRWRGVEKGVEAGKKKKKKSRKKGSCFTSSTLHGRTDAHARDGCVLLCLWKGGTSLLQSSPIGQSNSNSDASLYRRKFGFQMGLIISKSMRKIHDTFCIESKLWRFCSIRCDVLYRNQNWSSLLRIIIFKE